MIAIATIVAQNSLRRNKAIKQFFYTFVVVGKDQISR